MQGHIHLTENLLKIGDKNYNLRKYRNIYVAGFGKASGSMAQALEELLKERIGIFIKYGLLQKIPASIIDHIQNGVDGKAEETPKTKGNYSAKIF